MYDINSGDIMNNKNIVDKFLEGYENINKEKVVYKRVYKYPKKIESIIGFSFSLLILIILISIFSFNGIYLFLLVMDILVVIYYGLNLFTKKGFGLGKTIEVGEDKNPKDEESMKDKVQ